jgi:hypothetical protein
VVEVVVGKQPDFPEVRAVVVVLLQIASHMLAAQELRVKALQVEADYTQ